MLESLVVHRMQVLLLVVVGAVLRLVQLQAAPQQHRRQGDHHQERLCRLAVGLGRNYKSPSPRALLADRGQ